MMTFAALTRFTPPDLPLCGRMEWKAVQNFTAKTFNSVRDEFISLADLGIQNTAKEILVSASCGNYYLLTGLSYQTNQPFYNLSSNSAYSFSGYVGMTTDGKILIGMATRGGSASFSVQNIFYR